MSNDSLSDGLLPAARRLGLKVNLTDSADAYRQQYNTDRPEACPDEIIACDVFNPLAVIGDMTCRATGSDFSDCDHLQASTAIAARYVGLPRGKLGSKRLTFTLRFASAWRASATQSVVPR